MAEHLLKVVPPYFDALLDGSKTFEVRANDRGFQRGDTLVLREFGRHDQGLGCDTDCNDSSGSRCLACHKQDYLPHESGRQVEREVSFVFSGDPRFGGVEPGHVVLGLAEVTS